MTPTELEQALLELVAEKGYRPVKPSKIAKKLKLGDDELRDLKRLVKRLVHKGQLAYGEAHTVRLPDKTKKKPDRITGVFRRMSAGFGFVRPAGTVGGRDAGEDIYIPAKSAGDAASGDVVLVRLSKSQDDRRGPNKQGQIVEVLERETHQFVGSYSESDGSGFVQIDGGLFTQPILVGDGGAQNVREDDKVVIEMVRFPSHVHEGEAVILNVLGQRGEPGVDTISMIHEFNLPDQFEEDVLEDSRTAAEVFDESVGPDRTDLTQETIITIDPVDARDFDDAISLEKVGDHWRLGVHIADVSHFVQEKTALDREARNRATSVYLPDRVIPMLPEIISNNLASLQPDRIRYSKTVFIEFTAEGARVSVEPHSAAIRSCRRFTYEEVDDYLAAPNKWKKKLTPEVHGLLGRMHTLAMILRRRRRDAGSLELSMPEVKIDLDNDGRVSGAHLAENTESHQIIEEFMLSANEAVGELLNDNDLLFLRRVHGSPNPLKLAALADFSAELGYKMEDVNSRFELQSLLERVKGQGEERAINYAMLRSMQKAVYSPEAEGHYALASECYCHFTSPIRRYPDLTVHRLLEQLIRKQKPKLKFDELAALGEHCSEREQRATSAERELIKVKLLNYFTDRIGEEMEAVITGVQEFGLFAQGIEMPAEGLIHISSLQDDYYKYDKRTHSLTGFKQGHTFRLGDHVRIAVVRVDVDRRELDFRLVQGTGRRSDRRSRTGDARSSTNQRPSSKRRPSGKGKVSGNQSQSGNRSGKKKSSTGSKPTGNKPTGKKPTGKTTSKKSSPPKKKTKINPAKKKPTKRKNSRRK